MKDPQLFNSKSYAEIKLNNRSIYFLAVVDPTLYRDYQKYFTPIESSLKKALKNLPLKKEDTLILLSHSGMDSDLALVKKFPRINWVIGAHSQSYTIRPTEEGSTKLVQVLARNHYLGSIKFSPGEELHGKFELLEVREELAKKLDPSHPTLKLISGYRSKLKEIQKVEQDRQSLSFGEGEKLPTFRSCQECHTKQTEFWQGTAHAISYMTLYKKEAHYNPQCVKCHSVGFQQKDGFSGHKSIVTKGDPSLTEAQLEKYWDQLAESFSKVESVRELSSEKRRSLSQKWNNLDTSFEIEHNFANVQCLNCHQQTHEHPFESDNSAIKNNSHGLYQAKCVSCHTQDQSPKWYEQSGAIDNNVFQAKLKSVSCPRS